MILPKGPHLGRMLTYVGMPLVYLFAWDVCVVAVYKVLHWTWIGLSDLPLGLYGSVIGLIVGFRNNTAFARWWEARILWGSIVNNTRSLGRQVCAMVDSASRTVPESEAAAVGELQRRLIYLQIAFVHALRQALRGLDAREELTRLLEPEDLEMIARAPNVPLAIQMKTADLLREARDRRWIHAMEWQAMDRNVDDLADAQGGAERIKNTPIPKQYDYFPMLFVRAYCVLLPCGMVSHLGWLTPVGSTLVGFMFLALEKIGRDLENPFENTIFDVPMTSICRNIEITLRHMLGEKELPDPVRPERGVLW